MPQNKKTTTKFITKPLLISLLLCLIIIGLPWSKALPWLANHYQFALPGVKGLPYEITTNGWSYQNLATCANAEWCEVNQNAAYYSDYPVCMREADLKQAKRWPLVQIATLWTLGQSPQPILVDEKFSKPDAGHILGQGAIYVHRNDGCYTQYTMTSGP
jgi:hypothetical protein